MNSIKCKINDIKIIFFGWHYFFCEFIVTLQTCYVLLSAESFSDKPRFWSKVCLIFSVYKFWFCWFFFKRRVWQIVFFIYIYIYSFSKINTGAAMATLKVSFGTQVYGSPVSQHINWFVNDYTFSVYLPLNWASRYLFYCNDEDCCLEIQKKKNV